jgi:hypothetical protein
MTYTVYRRRIKRPLKKNKDGDEIAKIIYVAYLTPGFHRDPLVNVTKRTHSPNKAKSKFISTYPILYNKKFFKVLTIPEPNC